MAGPPTPNPPAATGALRAGAPAPSPAPAFRSPLADAAVAVLFVVLLLLPAMGYILGLRVPAGSEKRHPTPVPVLADAKHTFWTFPDRFTAYFNDRFTFRADLVRLHALGVYRLFATVPNATVLIGRDGWLFYADDFCLDDYRSDRPFTAAELLRWRDVLEARRAWLEKRGIRFLVVFVPDKHLVYPQYMPEAYPRRGQVPRMNQLADFLVRESRITVVNTKPALVEAADRERIYHKTDSHWNDRGALVGYRAIVGALGAWFERVRPREAGEFEPVAEMTPGWDLPAMLRLSDVIPEENLALRPRTPRRAKVIFPAEPDARWNDGLIKTQVEDASLPRAVFFRDSFCSALVPFLAEHFSRAAFSWQSDFDLGMIEEEKPDVVVLQIAGRKLYQLAAFNPPEMEERTAPEDRSKASGIH